MKNYKPVSLNAVPGKIRKNIFPKSIIKHMEDSNVI